MSSPVPVAGSDNPLSRARIKPDPALREWFRARVEAEPYWFHRITLADGLVTPGWSDPETDKLPRFGLPQDMTGMRVLDVGCAEGFFSFEAERRGASEVVAIDSMPESVRRCTLCRDALGSRVQPYLANVYDLSPRTFGSFDLVMFFGVLYHLRHPLLALEKLLSVCSGTMLLQTATWEVAASGDLALARFDPFGITSGTPENPIHDPTVFWRPNARAVFALLESTGFRDVELLSDDPVISIAVRAAAPHRAPGTAPDPATAPWS